jgi:hypothetical protein
MGEPRYSIAGVRDYTGASLEELIADINQLYADTLSLIPELHKIEEEVRKNSGKLDDPDDILSVIRYHISLFEDYAKDLRRLVDELPQRVEDSHIKIIKNIHENATIHSGGMILEFKKDHIIRRLKDEELRPLLDEIYSSIRQHLGAIRSLSALKGQLATYINLSVIREATVNHADETTKVAPKNRIEPLNMPSGTEWKDVSVRFIGSEEICVSVGRTSFGVHNYQRCGFADLRSKAPNEQWRILESFAKNHGELTVRDYEIAKARKIKNFKKHISLLRDKLKRLFNIPGPPITVYSKKTKSWKLNFTISAKGPSYPEDDYS